MLITSNFDLQDVSMGKVNVLGLNSPLRLASPLTCTCAWWDGEGCMYFGGMGGRGREL